MSFVNLYLFGYIHKFHHLLYIDLIQILQKIYPTLVGQLWIHLTTYERRSLKWECSPHFVDKVFKDAQGKISYISSLTTSVTFVADGEWYIPGMLGSIQHAATIPANANYIKYYILFVLFKNEKDEDAPKV